MAKNNSGSRDRRLPADPESESVDFSDLESPAGALASIAADTSWQITAASDVEDMAFTVFYPIPEGRGVRGKFLGAGPPKLMQDPQSDDPTKKRPVATWYIGIGQGRRLQIPGSSQVDEHLAAYPLHAEVAIFKQPGKVQSKRGRQVSQYIMSDPPSPPSPPAYGAGRSGSQRDDSESE